MTKKNKKRTYNQNSAIRGALRRSFVRSPVIQEIMKQNRKEEVQYNKDGSESLKKAVFFQCNVCKKWERRKKISVDHIEPVISIEEGFVDWNTFVDRLFVSIDKLQVLCEDCHSEKTKKERNLRKTVDKDKIK